MIQTSWSTSYALQFQTRKKTRLSIYKARNSSVCNEAASNQQLYCFNDLTWVPITPISTIIHLVPLCNTYISELLTLYKL